MTALEVFESFNLDIKAIRMMNLKIDSFIRDKKVVSTNTFIANNSVICYVFYEESIEDWIGER